MREIIFRGKRVDNGEWVYGGIIFGKRDDFTLICESVSIYDYYDVDRKTVGQFTGLYDKNGIKIFEGDIVRVCAGEYCYGVWEYDSTFEVSDIRGVGLDFTNYEEIYVVGNIYEVTP